MVVHERLLKACRTHQVPHRELLELFRPIKGTVGEERRKLQDQIADEIERKYPLREECLQGAGKKR